MDWMQQVDAYCERTDFSYWSEPVNAVTNAAFLIAAATLWPRVRGLPLARALTVILAVIGVGSFLFHTHATAWAATADVAPILAFILVYLFAANRHYWGLGFLPSLGLTALFVPYAAATAPVFGLIPGLGASAAYAPVALLIFVHALLLRARLPETAAALGIGGGLLVVSIGFRALDGAVCDAFPLGTHFMWHILNATMLGWMIELYRRHMLRSSAEPVAV